MVQRLLGGVCSENAEWNGTQSLKMTLLQIFPCRFFFFILTKYAVKMWIKASCTNDPH